MILLGNSFPLTLIRRRAVIGPRPLADLQAAAAQHGFLSYWGHANTLPAARAVLGFDPAPPGHRPALTLSPDQLPTLEDRTFTEVWVLSPDYAPGFRPEIGKEVSAESIGGWQVLRISFSRCRQDLTKNQTGFTILT